MNEKLSKETYMNPIKKLPSSRYNNGRSPDEFAWKNFDLELIELKKNINYCYLKLEHALNNYYQSREEVWIGPSRDTYDEKINQLSTKVVKSINILDELYNNLFGINEQFKRNYSSTINNLDGLY